MEVKVARAEEIKHSRERWNRLVKSMKIPSIFLTWEWITMWIKHFGKDYKVLVLFICDRNEIMAILPLAQKIQRLEDGFLKVNAITFCGTIELYPDHLDIICKHEDADTYIEKTFEFLTNDYLQWDILHFALLASKGCLASWLQRVNKEKYKIKLLGKTIAPFISTKGYFNDYWMRFNNKKRFTINKKKKKLFNTKGVTFNRVETQEALIPYIEDFLILHEKRAEEKGIKSTFVGGKIYNFHREMSKMLLDLGWLRSYSLNNSNNNNNKMISAVYGFVFERKYYYYQTGMDPEWQKFGPGNTLNFKIIEELFNDLKIVEFDFLGGNEDYKTYWTKDMRFMLTFNIYNKNITGTIENWTNNLRNLFKSLLIKTFCYDSLKRLLKRRNE